MLLRTLSHLPLLQVNSLVRYSRDVVSVNKLFFLIFIRNNKNVVGLLSTSVQYSSLIFEPNFINGNCC